MGFFEQTNLKGQGGVGGRGRVLVSTIEVKASYVEIFLDSAYDMKFKFEPVIIPNKGDNT